MPGVFRFSVTEAVDECKRARDLGLPAVILFGIPSSKDERGSGADATDGVVQQAVSAIKASVEELCVITDVCLCEYTDHGHCGIVDNGRVDNDATLELLAQVALSQVQAGTDLVAPSAMMDGQVRAIRDALNTHGYTEVPIMGYAAKYASAFYGPFRVAADSTPQFGDRRSYQMDPANRRMAMREIESDIAEGADIVMIKPALAYLDVIKQARDRFDHPLAAYNVSGEYSMVKAAGSQGWIDEKMVTLELLTAIRRAGADIILSYHAKEVARWLRDEG